MRLREMKWGRKAVAAVSAVVLAATMTVAPLGGVQSAYAADAADTTGYVTCAAYRAATPAPEILGLSGIGTNDAFSTCGQLEWSSPFYYIFGTTEYNSNANPYMLNSVSNFNDSTSYTNAMTYYTRQGGPNAAMKAYGTDSDSDAVWDMLPDVILGTGNSDANQVDYNAADYAVAAGEANSDSDYTTIGVNYQMSSIYTMITSMYDLAAAGDQVVADSNGTKQLRYGNATNIAKKYEQYVNGTQGYVLQQLAANSAEKKTVALVNNYDATSGTYTIVATGVSEGTAASNRYLEAVQNVAINLGDTTTTVTQEELAKVDLIMLGSQSGKEDIASTEDILNTFTTEMQNKTFWVNSENGSAGSCYGVVMNSVENAQNIGRILGCLYPEYIDQDQWIAYYYDNFYHLNEGKLADAIDNAMDGVRNWDATGADLTLWTVADAYGYDEAAVVEKLAAGVAYIQTNASSVPSLLTMSDDYEEGPDTSSSTTVIAVPTQDMYRLYNPNSGEHFYTADAEERDGLIAAGWNYENIGWTAPATSNTPVYRMYNPNPGPNGSGEHHYTMKADERDTLIEAGWTYEGVGWYSDDEESVVLYREYNPNAYNCNHNYTTKKEEHEYLVSIGWNDEGTAWYGVAE